MTADLSALLAASTPGRWRVDGDVDGLDVVGEHAVARVAGAWTMADDAEPAVKERALADAALIALAPVLAQACLDAVAALDRIESEPEDALKVQDIAREALAVLRAATRSEQ